MIKRFLQFILLLTLMISQVYASQTITPVPNKVHRESFLLAQEDHSESLRESNTETLSDDSAVDPSQNEPMPDPAVEEEEPAAPKLTNLQLALLIAAPMFIIFIILGVMYFFNFQGESIPKDKIKKGDSEKKKAEPIAGKGGKRLQTAISLLNYQHIEREGSLKTDYKLKCLKGPNEGLIFEINKHVSKIGRRSTDGRINDIEISSTAKEVSRKQALLVYKSDEDTFFLINESDVPMRVNKERVKDAYPLRDGDEISISKGEVVLKLFRETVEI